MTGSVKMISQWNLAGLLMEALVRYAVMLLNVDTAHVLV